MKTMHLFAGLGGGLLADVILGHEPVCAVEINPYCCRVLRERKSDGWFQGMHVHEGDVREFDFSKWNGRVDQISAGFPCQDISAAGRGAGLEGEKSGLVSEVWRAIDAVRPALVFLENSPLIRTRGREVVWKELQGRGYVVVDGTLGASDVGAPHIRKRWWCLAADPDKIRWFGGWTWTGHELSGRTEFEDVFTDPDRLHIREQSGWIGREDRKEETEFTTNAPDTMRNGLQDAVQSGWISEADGEAIKAAERYCGLRGWNPIDSDFCGMVHGLPDPFHSHKAGNKGARIKGLGNAQVPLQAALAWVLLIRKLQNDLY